MKNLKRNILIVILILVFILFFTLKDEFFDVLNVLSTVDISWFLVSLICLGMYILFGALTLKETVDALNGNKYKFLKSLRMVILGLFFNGITPSSSGGQPFQIYLMSKEGINPRKGSSITIQYTILFQFALLLVAFLSIILNYLFEFFPKIPFVQHLVVIGLIIHSAVVCLLLMISFFPKFNQSVIKFFVDILAKIHVVKDKEKTLEKFTDYIDEFNGCAKELFKNKKLVIRGVIYQTISLCFFYSIPLFLMYSINYMDAMWILPVIVGTSYVNVIGAFIPSPGGAGGFEYAFVKFFGYYLAGPVLTTIMLLWRFVTYYFVLIIGCIILLFYKFKDKEDVLEELPNV